MAQPTMQQVAERAGVSTALVSLVMRDAPNVSDYRRRLVLEAAEELGYRPNVLARNLASRRTSTIGVVLNDLHNPFFAEAVDGIQEAADAAGYRILLGNGRRSPAGEHDALETFLQFRVDGVILTGPRMSIADVERAAEAAPVVMIGRTTRSRLVDTVNNDETIGVRLAIDHLAQLGHRRIAHITGGAGAGARARLRAYERVMAEHSLEPITARGDFTEEGGYAAARELMRSHPSITAIFAANDQAAAGALDRLEHEGIRVPDGVSLVGYDNTALAAMHHMSITTVDQPRQDLGRVAMELLQARLDGSSAATERAAVHHVVSPRLVVRRSSGPPRAP